MMPQPVDSGSIMGLSMVNFIKEKENVGLQKQDQAVNARTYAYIQPDHFIMPRTEW